MMNPSSSSSETKEATAGFSIIINDEYCNNSQKSEVIEETSSPLLAQRQTASIKSTGSSIISEGAGGGSTTSVLSKKCVSFSVPTSEKKILNVKDCLKYMQEGSEMIKVKSKTRIYKRHFQLDPSLSYIDWKPTSKKQNKAMIPINSIKEIRTGKTTEHLRDNQLISQYPFEYAFSIIYGETFQTLDLVTKSSEVASIWICGLNFLIANNLDTTTAQKISTTPQSSTRQLFKKRNKSENDIENTKLITTYFNSSPPPPTVQQLEQTQQQQQQQRTRDKWLRKIFYNEVMKFDSPREQHSTHKLRKSFSASSSSSAASNEFQVSPETNTNTNSYYLTEAQSINLIKNNLNSYASQEKISHKFREMQLGKPLDMKGKINCDEFVELYKDVSTRAEIYFLLAKHSKNKEYLTIDELLLFLENEQKIPRSLVTQNECLDIIEKYEPNDLAKSRGFLTIDGFTNYLQSNECDIFDSTHLVVCEDMDQPLNNYFISTSYNTYLISPVLSLETLMLNEHIENREMQEQQQIDSYQGGKKSSILSNEPSYNQHLAATAAVQTALIAQQLQENYQMYSLDAIAYALRKGARCIHIKCWDGLQADNYMPIVSHSKSSEFRVSFYETIKTIQAYAFERSPYPLIVYLENHCHSLEQQLHMARIIKDVFGNSLYTRNTHSDTLIHQNETSNSNERERLPSPNSLKYKILLMGVKLEQTKNRMSLTEPRENYDVVTEEIINDDFASSLKGLSLTSMPSRNEKSTKIKLAVELSDLFCLSKVNEFQSQQTNPWIVNCFSEYQAINLASLTSHDKFICHNRNYLKYIVPGGAQINSGIIDPSNYHSCQDLWNYGCQFVAISFQTTGLMMDLYNGRFLSNGNCGYTLKPFSMREDITVSQPTIDNSISSSTIREEMTTADGQSNTAYSIENNRKEGLLAKRFTLNESSHLHMSKLINTLKYSRPLNNYSFDSAITLHIRVISGMNLPKPMNSASKGDCVDPYVMVELFGLPVDCELVKTRTIDGNGYNPIFGYESFEFNVRMPELALIRFMVLDDYFIVDDFIAQATYPLETCQMGYRNVKLLNSNGDIIPNAFLFIQLEISRKNQIKRSRQSLKRYRSINDRIRSLSSTSKQYSLNSGYLGKEMRGGTQITSKTEETDVSVANKSSMEKALPPTPDLVTSSMVSNMMNLIKAPSSLPNAITSSNATNQTATFLNNQIKSIGVKMLDDIFKQNAELIYQTVENRNLMQMAQVESNYACGLHAAGQVKQCLQKLIESMKAATFPPISNQLSTSLAISTQQITDLIKVKHLDRVPYIEYYCQIPDLLKKMINSLNNFTNVCSSIVNTSDMVYEKLLDSYKKGSELCENINDIFKSANLKSRHYLKSLENFKWNMRILKNQLDLIIMTKNEAIHNLEEFREAAKQMGLMESNTKITIV